MNYRYMGGTVTGDAFNQVNTFCGLTDDRYNGDLIIGAIAPLDAPAWLNTGRMVCVKSDSDGRDVQFQQHCLRG